jgi:branched-chain amino acid transport system ATP-binding protein
VILDISDLHVYYGEGHVLQGVSLKVEDNELVALLGRNGVGKSTLVRSVMGITAVRKGHVMFKGEDITNLPSHVIARKHIGYVPQGRFVCPSLTVYENLAVTSRGNGREDKWDIGRVLDVFPRLRERLNNRGSQLSGGEQQMLAIARALVTNPHFLIMDEPTEGLAPAMVREVGKLLETIKQKGYPIFLVEQNTQFAAQHADVVYVMSKGVVVYRGSPDDLKCNEEIKREYLSV